MDDFYEDHLEYGYEEDPEWQTVCYRRGRLINRDFGDTPRRLRHSYDRYEQANYPANNGPSNLDEFYEDCSENGYEDDSTWQTVRYRRGRLTNREFGDPPRRPRPSHDRYERVDYPVSNGPVYDNAKRANYPANTQANHHRYPVSRPANDFEHNYHDNGPTNNYTSQAYDDNYRASYAEAARPKSYKNTQQRVPNSYKANNHRSGYNRRGYGASKGRNERGNRRQAKGNGRAHWQNGSRSRGRSGQRGPQQRRQRSGYSNQRWANNSNNRQRSGYSNQRRANNKQQQPPRRAQRQQDPDFTTRTRTIHKLIKAAHHLSNVSARNPPRAIAKITKLLAESIKPAEPTSSTGGLIRENAEMWEESTLLILKEHYTESIKANLRILVQLKTDNWQQNYDIASAWARSHFGRKLARETLDSVYAKIIDALQSRTKPATRPVTRSHTPALPEMENRVVEVQDNEDRSAQLERPILQQERYDDITEVQEEPQAPTLPLPQRQPRVRQNLMRPTPTSGTLQVTADVHRISRVPEQQTEATEPEERSEPREPPLPLLTRSSPPPSIPTSPPPFHFSPLNPFFSSSSSSSSTPSSPQLLQAPVDPPASQTTSETAVDATVNPSEHATAQPQEFRASDDASVATDAPKESLPTSAPLSITISDGETPEKVAVRPSRGMLITEGTSPFGNIGPLKTPRLQSRLTLLTPKTQIRFSPFRHNTTRDKMNEWSLLPRKKWLYIGDSNLSRFPSYEESHIQIESYPGARFEHAEALLARTPVSPGVEKLILSFGINHKSDDAEKVTIPQIRKVLLVAKVAFPKARVLIPVLSFSRYLEPSEQENLRDLNVFLVSYYDHIPTLSRTDFSTEKDHIHWTKSTAAHMFRHWRSHLNLMTP